MVQRCSNILNSTDAIEEFGPVIEYVAIKRNIQTRCKTLQQVSVQRKRSRSGMTRKSQQESADVLNPTEVDWEDRLPNARLTSAELPVVSSPSERFDRGITPEGVYNGRRTCQTA